MTHLYIIYGGVFVLAWLGMVLAVLPDNRR